MIEPELIKSEKTCSLFRDSRHINSTGTRTDLISLQSATHRLRNSTAPFTQLPQMHLCNSHNNDLQFWPFIYSYSTSLFQKIFISTRKCNTRQVLPRFGNRSNMLFNFCVIPNIPYSYPHQHIGRCKNTRGSVAILRNYSSVHQYLYDISAIYMILSGIIIGSTILVKLSSSLFCHK